MQTDRKARFEAIRRQIGQICLIAASKKQSVDAIQEFYTLGQRDFGENYVQELIEKAEVLKQRGCIDIRWHLIGSLQRNKAKKVIPYLSAFHALDSWRLAETLAKFSESLAVFVQVNIDRETTKAGLDPESVIPFLQDLRSLKTLDVRGLMCIPAPGSGGNAFHALKRLSKQAGNLTKGELSMGMSEDYLLAIKEGATHVRLGTALFGKRPAGR